ncbi:MAG: DivIVA domain-containing protein [Propionicimonas sp.]|nr:DivIVA domain-containing protein [Propionicimonas sp.]
MTLTLEQVRQTRFHLARRNGYEPVDVDNFVDKVEATLSQLTEENETLKQQVEALSSSEPSSIFVPSDSGESDGLRQELQHRQGELDGARGELEALRAELQGRQEEISRLQDELAGKQRQIDSLGTEVARLQPSPDADALPKASVENIVVTSSAEASPAVARLLQMATEQAERLVGESQVEAQRLVGEARSEAETVIDNANKKAHETLTDARTRSDRIESEARVNAERVTSDALTRADAVNSEADRRRDELFTQLEQDRDVLRGKVDKLRQFEGSFRANLTNQLQGQIKMLEEAVLEPSDTPEILSEPAPESATPRLDALLGD